MSSPLPWPVILLASALSTGCAGWPLAANLPERDPDAQEMTDEPGDLVPVTWTEIADTSDRRDDDPTEAQVLPLTQGEGAVRRAVLAGTGWWDGAEQVVYADEDCDSEGVRSPADEGDYVGDVDFLRVDVAEDGQLCARVEVDNDNFGWDLLLLPVDACGVPQGVTREDGGVLGYGWGGADGDWAVPVLAGERYAVLLSAYFPNDANAELGYDLGISLVWPDRDGSVGLCPTLPEPASPDEEAE